PPPLTSHPPADRTALPSPHRAIPTPSVRFQIVSGAIAEPSIDAGGLQESAAPRNAYCTLPPSPAFHSTTANSGLIPPATGIVVLVQCLSDARISAFRQQSPAM